MRINDVDIEAKRSDLGFEIDKNMPLVNGRKFM